MAKLSDVLLYLCEKYPNKSELSNARLTKMVYLSDWRSSIEHNRQLTNLKWVFNHYGPFLPEVLEKARQTPGLAVRSDTNFFGSRKEVIERKGPLPHLELSQTETDIMDAVIRETKALYWKDFIGLVYSTYPIVTQDRYVPLDLPALASLYNEQKSELKR